MPSALETLVKILKLEREQGYKNAAVIGGLGNFSENWERQANAQARKAEHHVLVEEIVAALRQYDAIESKDDRHNTVAYLLERITNRVPMPDELKPRLAEWEAQLAAQAAENPPAEQREGRQQQDRRERHELERHDRDRREREQDRPASDAELENEVIEEADTLLNAPPGDSPTSEISSTSSEQAHEPQRESQREQHRDSRRDSQRDTRRDQNQRRDRRPPSKPPRARDDDEREGGGYDDFGGMDESADFEIARGPIKMDIPVQPKLARPPRKPRQPISTEEARDILRGLSADIEVVKGVGPKMAKVMNKVGIYNIKDMLYYLPRRYDDYTRIGYISRLTEGMRVTVIGTVRHTEIRIGRGGRKDFFLVIDDSSASMGVTFFGQFYLQQQIRTGQQIRLHGDTEVYGNRIQMANPEWDFLDVEDLQTVRIVPVYPLTEGLTARFMRRTIERTVEYWSEKLPDYVPESVLDRAELADLGWAIKNLHFPESEDHLTHARRRYIFDQLLLLQLAILGNRRVWQGVPSIPLDVTDQEISDFASLMFPYPLTGDQQVAIRDVQLDVAKTIPMNRLLQGDVGSGKTAVAVTAIGMALMRGKQAALMAPTGILAEQHFQNISRTLENMPAALFPKDRPPVVALLTSAITSGERTAVYQGLANGSIDVVIGTHAIIQEGVEFSELAVAIIDEQHRFGVEQRGALRGKGTNPHLLVMTATPIPRTLALTVHADLDLSVIREMPPGRVPIETLVIEPIRRERAYEFIENELSQGRQAFIVYPLVEASETISEVKAAVDEYEKMQKVFHRYRVGLLHGRLNPREKDEVMAEFRDHKFDVLVTTSVAEVGVDIPNASVIMIEGANRFGLAQLHQFRGRVGRGEHKSYCLLLTDTLDAASIERLKIVRDHPNGFDLAEKDFEQRGAGDLVGTRQSGRNQLQLVEEMSPELVALAQREARTIYEEDPELMLDEHRLLHERVSMLADERSDIS
jgi:ATP-dependent DNA helicase RecG